MSTALANAAVMKLVTNDGANFDAPVDVLRLSKTNSIMPQNQGIYSESSDQ
ncbi:hypothetical protein KIN20_034781 [Parelaphostrongylus tenuis]|uniref:Uncharacterized protein n=1 Tax=Parelaphostrongylus tenuis TaxID=148309 RepID=A0AAD5WJZ7_PARTN|nr:hypothetical protein KIN20_034781 [Parelaphostrongylus tenuis]